MKKFSVNLITKAIIKVVGKGPHYLHEPVLGKKEKTLPVPLSITEPVLGGSPNPSMVKKNELHN